MDYGVLRPGPAPWVLLVWVDAQLSFFLYFYVEFYIFGLEKFYIFYVEFSKNVEKIMTKK